MNRFNVLFVLLFLITLTTSSNLAQTAPNTLWTSYFNYLQSGNDRSDFLWDMEMDTNGNSYVIANSRGNKGQYDMDVSVFKFNSEGGIEWSQTFSDVGDSFDEAISVNHDNSGNVFAVWNLKYGRFNVEKFDAAGNHLWSYSSPSAWDHATDAVVNSSGEIFICGYSRLVAPNENDFGVLLVKLGPSGNEIYNNLRIVVNARSDNHCDPRRIILDSNEDPIIAGYYDHLNINYESPFAIKYSQASGSESWTYFDPEDSSFSGGSVYTPMDLKLLPDNSFYMVGQYVDVDVAYDRLIPVSYKISSSGSQLWKVLHSTITRKYIQNIDVDEENSLYILAEHQYNTQYYRNILIKYDQSGNHVFDKDIFRFGASSNLVHTFLLVKSSQELYIGGPYDYNGFKNAVVRFDSNGDTVWTKIFDIDNSASYQDFSGKINNTHVFMDDNRNIIYGASINSPVATENDADVIVAKTELSSPNNVKNILNEIPSWYLLEQNYPNPFNPSTKIKYTIPNVGTSFMKLIQLKVYDILGNEIATLVNEEKPSGTYEVDFDGTRLASGIYFYKIQTGRFTETKKMILLK